MNIALAEAVKEAGFEPVLLSINEGTARGYKGLMPDKSFDVDAVMSQENQEDYLTLVLPGSVGNPDILRLDKDARKFIKDILDADKFVAAICHAHWVLVDDGLISDRNITLVENIKTDLTTAGANWKEEEVVICKGGSGKIISSRNPNSFEAFNKAIVEHLH